MQTQINKLIEKFKADLEVAVAVAAGNIVLEAFDPKGRNTPKAPRPQAHRRAPAQLCPVPRCPNRAAPIFGMVCSNHRGISKAKIKAYREARRAAKK